MNKKISAVIVSVLMVVVLVYAQSIDNKNTEVSKAYKTALESINLSNYDYTDLEQDGLYKRCLYKENAINTCSQWISQDQLDDWELQRIEGIANATIERQNRAEIVKDTEGAVTITEKK